MDIPTSMSLPTDVAQFISLAVLQISIFIIYYALFALFRAFRPLYFAGTHPDGAIARARTVLGWARAIARVGEAELYAAGGIDAVLHCRCMRMHAQMALLLCTTSLPLLIVYALAPVDESGQAAAAESGFARLALTRLLAQRGLAWPLWLATCVAWLNTLAALWLVDRFDERAHAAMLEGARTLAPLHHYALVVSNIPAGAREGDVANVFAKVFGPEAVVGVHLVRKCGAVQPQALPVAKLQHGGGAPQPAPVARPGWRGRLDAWRAERLSLRKGTVAWAKALAALAGAQAALAALLLKEAAHGRYYDPPPPPPAPVKLAARLGGLCAKADPRAKTAADFQKVAAARERAAHVRTALAQALELALSLEPGQAGLPRVGSSSAGASSAGAPAGEAQRRAGGGAFGCSPASASVSVSAVSSKHAASAAPPLSPPSAPGPGQQQTYPYPDKKHPQGTQGTGQGTQKGTQKGTQAAIVVLDSLVHAATAARAVLMLASPAAGPAAAGAPPSGAHHRQPLQPGPGQAGPESGESGPQQPWVVEPAVEPREVLWGPLEAGKLPGRLRTERLVLLLLKIGSFVFWSFLVAGIALGVQAALAFLGQIPSAPVQTLVAILSGALPPVIANLLLVLMSSVLRALEVALGGRWSESKAGASVQRDYGLFLTLVAFIAPMLATSLFTALLEVGQSPLALLRLLAGAVPYSAYTFMQLLLLRAVSATTGMTGVEGAAVRGLKLLLGLARTPFAIAELSRAPPKREVVRACWASFGNIVLLSYAPIAPLTSGFVLLFALAGWLEAKFDVAAGTRAHFDSGGLLATVVSKQCCDNIALGALIHLAVLGFASGDGGSAYHLIALGLLLLPVLAGRARVARRRQCGLHGEARGRLSLVEAAMVDGARSRAAVRMRHARLEGELSAWAQPCVDLPERQRLLGAPLAPFAPASEARAELDGERRQVELAAWLRRYETSAAMAYEAATP